MLKKNILGKRFGNLIVVGEYKRSFHPSGKISRNLICLCRCGKRMTANINNLRSGDTRSCGCLAKIGNNLRHGFSKTRFYLIWAAINRRSGKVKYYKHVSVSLRWKVFLNFKRDMYNSYLKHCSRHGESNTSIDRINNLKGYYFSNCRWATDLVQSRNRNRNYVKKND